MKESLYAMNTTSLPIRLVPMAIVMGTIFFLSHQPGGQLDVPPIEHLDKVCHFVIYGLLAGTILWAPSEEVKNKSPKSIVIVTIIICLLYGVSDEYHQSFIPDRYPSAADLAADLCGVLFVCGIWAKKRLS